MLKAPSFSEDMLPRHFPKTKGQLEQKPAVAPMPTLPGLSLLLDDDNKGFKPEPTQITEPKKSFEQWKQQHHAIFVEKAVAQHRRPDKKQVRFESDDSNPQPAKRHIPSPVSSNLELSYNEESHVEHFCKKQRQKDYHQHNSKEAVHCAGYEKKISLQNHVHKPTSPLCAGDRAYNSAKSTSLYAIQRNAVELPHFNQMLRSESMKENRISAANVPVHNEPRQCNGKCCQPNWEMMNYPTCNHGLQQPNGCVDQRQVHHSHQHDGEPKAMVDPFSVQMERNFKEQLTDDTLLSIMEEQQKHILVQQSQIMMQQKQNMMQQKQIFMLQYQVQQLLLRNGNIPNESPKKLCHTSICEHPTTQTLTNALQKTINTPQSSKIDPKTRHAATTKSSIGVMTSFMGNVTDGMPNGMQQFNERFASKLANEKFIENVGGEYSYKDSMLDRINDAIKNSSAMIDYRNNGTTTDGCAPPNQQQPDMNIATQALFYESSSTNNGCTSEQKMTDRSFALYMLGMKYDCGQDDASKNIDKRNGQQPLPTNGKSDQVSVNLSPEVYDYLKRHGLLKQE